MRRQVATAAAIAVTALSGCADPYTDGASARAGASSVPRSRTTTPRQTQIEPPRSSATLGPSPTRTIAAFATIYTNWTAANVAARLTRLAGKATGEAAAEMSRAAQESRGDYELHRSGVFNRGSVQTVAPRPGHRNEYVVVTLEATGARSKQYAGLKPAFHVTLARVAPTATGWTVSSWRPQS